MNPARRFKIIRALAAVFAATAIALSAASVVNPPRAEAWPTIVYGGGGVGLMQFQ
ncbi:hypothetical protein AB0A74_28540 [Saccharothrix sp. NPDC042600]|uniref:hypothetical protein n=1 Tax=Saccharothrix TaxID=2071 RepID=UPI0033F58ED6|nr:hypothetical protein GCM10017745_82810 [Saccharothrix mutabilis subsp. capreolus]